MKRLLILGCVVVAVLVAGDGASAQMLLQPGQSPFNPLPPPPPPSPRIEVPPIPQMDAPAVQNYGPAPTPSFSDRISTCLDQGAAAGLGPNERSAYSRSCAD
jgi:hypothetical protein